MIISETNLVTGPSSDAIMHDGTVYDVVDGRMEPQQTWYCTRVKYVVSDRLMLTVCSVVGIFLTTLLGFYQMG